MTGVTCYSGKVRSDLKKIYIAGDTLFLNEYFKFLIYNASLQTIN